MRRMYAYRISTDLDIQRHKTNGDFDDREKCDADNRAEDKTKPNVCNPMGIFIVQRKKPSFSAKTAEKGYIFDIEIAWLATSNMVFPKTVFGDEIGSGKAI